MKKYNYVLYNLDLIEHQIDKWYQEEKNFNEGAILDNEYSRIKYLIWRIAEEISKKK